LLTVGKPKTRMDIIEKVRKPILKEMQLFRETFVTSLKTDNPLLSNVNDYILQKSGKQLRPMLSILAAKMCGEVNQSSINGALSLELLHTASLVHDDVVDDTLERRGVASVNAHWNNKIAILSGDYMLSKSLNCASETNNLQILAAISKIGMELSDGELLQLAVAEQAKISESEYYNVIRKKTAFLFSACAEVGGLSVDATDGELEHLRNFGEYMGICFQIKDDIFDYTEDAQIGKPTGNDIREGKVTLPLIFALENATGESKNEVLKMIQNKEFSQENIQFITQFAHDNGGVEYASKQMELYKEKAIAELESFHNCEAKDSLKLCAEFAAMRSN
jgi:octaprenyl-diphosphate synthase